MRKLANYISFYRKKTGLSQHELGVLLGYRSVGQVSRHERHELAPPLGIALAYEVVFAVPISEIFPGVLEEVDQEVEQRIDQLKEMLGERSGRGRHAALTARKLEWIIQRRMSDAR